METTKERILEAAEKCPQAKETLKTLFPECFEEEDKSVDLKQRIIEHLLWVRSEGEYKGKSFYLSEAYDWKIVEDSFGSYCLIPTSK